MTMIRHLDTKSCMACWSLGGRRVSCIATKLLEDLNACHSQWSLLGRCATAHCKAGRCDRSVPNWMWTGKVDEANVHAISVGHARAYRSIIGRGYDLIGYYPAHGTRARRQLGQHLPAKQAAGGIAWERNIIRRSELSRGYPGMINCVVLIDRHLIMAMYLIRVRSLRKRLCKKSASLESCFAGRFKRNRVYINGEVVLDARAERVEHPSGG